MSETKMSREQYKGYRKLYYYLYYNVELFPRMKADWSMIFKILRYPVPQNKPIWYTDEDRVILNLLREKYGKQSIQFDVQNAKNGPASLDYTDNFYQVFNND